MTLVSFQCDCILVCNWQIVTDSYSIQLLAVTGSYWQLLGSSRKMVPYYWHLQLFAVIHTWSTIQNLRYTTYKRTNVSLIFYIYDETKCVYIFIVFSLTCDKLICKQPMCDKLIDKSMAVWYTNKQNQKRVYLNEEKANVCRFPVQTLRCDPHEARIYGVSNKKPLFNCV